MKANHYYTLQSRARVRMHRDAVGTRRIEWVGAITLDLCIEEYRKPNEQLREERKFQAGEARYPKAGK